MSKLAEEQKEKMISFFVVVKIAYQWWNIINIRGKVLLDIFIHQKH
ncbi:hypothetical protein [Spiroplasma sp. SV19]|nr:hypothetical protein [Spiroplasma sp. SV19]